MKNKKTKSPLPISEKEVKAKGGELEPKKKTKERTLEENLNDKVFVNYNLLLNLRNISLQLEEIKRILLSSHEMQKYLIQRLLQEEESKKKPKGKKEGIFR